jgi:predicted HTH transcriptional regulator
MMLTLVFLRFIGEKYEDGIKKLRERLIAEGLNPDDEKISNYCAAEKAKLPEIDLSLGGVTARCFASDFYLGFMREHGLNNEGLNLSEKEKIVYELIKKHKQVTSKFIIETTSFSHATVERTIKKLSEELKCIRRNGSKKTGYWEIITEDK